MSNDVADCPYCDEGLIVEGFEECICDKCGRRMKYDETFGFGARIDNNRYRKRNGMEELNDD